MSFALYLVIFRWCTRAQELVSRNYAPPPTLCLDKSFCLHISINKNRCYFISFSLYLTCSCPYSYNLMLTAIYMLRPYIYIYIYTLWIITVYRVNTCKHLYMHKNRKENKLNKDNCDIREITCTNRDHKPC